jgi:hypothetical protein
VASGGRDTGIEFWGNAEYTLNVDTGKAGLWPGGFLRVIANSGFGESVLTDSGAISPVNTSALLPAPNVENTGLMPCHCVPDSRPYRVDTTFTLPRIGSSRTTVVIAGESS